MNKSQHQTQELKQELKQLKDKYNKLQEEKNELEKNIKFKDTQLKESEDRVKDNSEKIDELNRDLDKMKEFDFTKRDGEGIDIYGFEGEFDKKVALIGQINNMWRDNDIPTPILTKLYYK